MYTEDDLVRIAKRENNKKRSYLVVNPLQGKHIPVSPGRALRVFSELAGQLETYKEERLLVVGFAETATAIGAKLAAELGAGYIQTTREEIPGVDYLFFSEEHSHAAEQKLVRDDLDRIMDGTDRVIFAEDEVTTGKTIWNLIAILEQRYGGKLKYAVAALLNGMSAEDMGKYAGRGIEVHSLVRICHDRFPEIADRAVEDGAYCQEDLTEAEYTARLEVRGWRDTRRLVNPVQYEEACEKFSKEVRERLPLKECKRLLVLGTEECMYPGLYLGSTLEAEGYLVKFHATTRSPIAVSCDAEYPLHCRYALCSLYGEGRKTFVYDIGSYDAVIIVTDAQGNGDRERRGELSLLNAVRKDAAAGRGNGAASEPGSCVSAFSCGMGVKDAAAESESGANASFCEMDGRKRNETVYLVRWIP